MSSRIIVATTLALLAAPISAQSLPHLDPKAIQPGVDTFFVTYGPQTLGRSIQETVAESEEGRAVWRQAYRFESAGGEVSTDSLWVDAATLLPIREVRSNSLGLFAVGYGAKGIITLHTPPSGAPARTRTPISGPVYASATLELIARSLPLAGGLEVPVSLFYGPPSTRGVVPMTYRVPQADSLRSKEGVVRRVWIVTVGAEGERTTFWIGQEDRRVLQFNTEEGNAVISFRREP